MTERELLDAVRQACRWSGLLTFHAYDARRSEAGYPDLCICGPHGLLFRELKTERGRVTQAQREWLDMLTEAGADADVWRPGDWPDRVLDEIHGIGGRCLPTTQRRAS
jgi:hypothetical protein